MNPKLKCTQTQIINNPHFPLFAKYCTIIVCFQKLYYLVCFQKPYYLVCFQKPYYLMSFILPSRRKQFFTLSYIQNKSIGTEQEMAQVFNQTFSADKPIYYPSNWKNGKTSLEQYEQFKNTWVYFLISNTFEIVVAVIWIFLIYAFCMGVKQIMRLRRLKDTNIEKIRNKKYLDTSFYAGIAFLGTVIIITNAIVLFQDWGFRVLSKGLIFFTLLFYFRHTLQSIWASMVKNERERLTSLGGKESEPKIHKQQ